MSLTCSDIVLNIRSEKNSLEALATQSGEMLCHMYVALSCPTEQRFVASNDLKRRKYEPVAAVFRHQPTVNVVELVPIDVGARGRPARSLRNLKPLLQRNYSKAVEEAGRAAIIASMHIYYGSETLLWTHPTM
jgi:hypothetical protein